jgi:FKBP-type peptidyl-prolyl cis-trans isomerase
MKGLAFYIGIVAIAILGCGKSEENNASSATRPGTATRASAPLKKVGFKTVKEGKGNGAQKGELLTLLYRGTLKDGTVFDFNMQENGMPSPGKDPLPMELGSGLVIPGWEIGLKGIKEGEIRELEIPSADAYGPQGQGKIPPNTDLYFTVKCLDIVKAGDEMTIDVTTLRPGKGKPVEKGDKVTIHYVGKFLNGKQFDSSRDRNSPLEFTIGAGELVPGFDKGVGGMRKGELRRVKIPPKAAYGADPSNGIPPNSVLEFEIELLTINGK